MALVLDRFEINISFGAMHWGTLSVPAETTLTVAVAKARNLCDGLERVYGKDCNIRCTVTRWHRGLTMEVSTS